MAGFGRFAQPFLLLRGKDPGLDDRSPRMVVPGWQRKQLSQERMEIQRTAFIDVRTGSAGCTGSN